MSAPLSEHQLQELRDDLLHLREQLHEQLEVQMQGSQDSAVALDQQKVGRVSRIDAIQQNQMDKANRGQAKRRLQQVDVALAVILSGDYGYCRQCDEPIGFPRLKARPETPLCLNCQQQVESQQ